MDVPVCGTSWTTSVVDRSVVVGMDVQLPDGDVENTYRLLCNEGCAT